MNEKSQLSPRKCINIDGKILYSESNQAWNLIKLKKEFLNEFYQLKEKRSKFSYNMIYYRSYEELEKAIKDLKSKDSIIPFLMFLYKDGLESG